MKLEILKNAGLEVVNLTEEKGVKFDSLHEALKYLDGLNLKCGKYSSTLKLPIPVKANIKPNKKWEDLTKKEKNELDGKIVGNYAYGPVFFIPLDIESVDNSELVKTLYDNPL